MIENKRILVNGAGGFIGDIPVQFVPSSTDLEKEAVRNNIVTGQKEDF